MEIVPYEFRPARFQDRTKGYWVTLFLFFDGTSTHTFYHQSEWIDNMCLAREIGVGVYQFTREILVTSGSFPDIFKTIEDYVSQSNSC